MDDDTAATAELVSELSGQSGDSSRRGRKTSIRNGKRKKLNTLLLAVDLFVPESELGNLRGREQGNHGVNAGEPPGVDLVGEPVAASRPRSDTEPPCCQILYPVDFCEHRPLTPLQLHLFDRFTWKRVDIDAPLAKHRDAVVSVHNCTICPRFERTCFPGK